MKIFFCILFYLSAFIPYFTIGQSTYLPEGSKYYHFIDRLEIKSKTDLHFNFSIVKPYNRKYILQESTYLDSTAKTNGKQLSKIDEYNLKSLKRNNLEWISNISDSNKTHFHTIYKNRQNLFGSNSNNFFLAFDPVIQIQAGTESFQRHNISLLTYGFTARGLISKRLGFSLFVTNNHENGPQFYKNRIIQYNAVPGEGNYSKNVNGSVNYLDARGYMTYTIAKYIDLQVGYDKNFIGNGYRSMFLSDHGSSYPFLKINTRIWKLNYENIYAKLESLDLGGIPKTSQKKFIVLHHLSMNLTKSFNLGLFESIVSARDDHFDFEYLNPIIFLRQAEGNVGSPDKAHVGIDFKLNTAQRFQFYGQFMLDEFLLHQFVKHTGYWANKWALQGGLKYIDALNVNNLDIQLEANIVRPFTYSHFDPITNYSSSNQSLADPIGANFHELITIVKFQPSPKWYLNARVIYYNQGLDSAGLNLGSNIFLDYRTRPRDYGFKIAGGNKASCLNASFNIAYELYDDLFIEATAFTRNYKVANSLGNNKTSFASIGLRWNMFKKDYNY